MAFSGKADQISWSAFINSGTVLAFVPACDKTPVLPPNLIIQWIGVRWIGATHHWRWSQGNLTCCNSKLLTIKTISTPRKINAILLNIKINWSKLVVVGMCGYKLATNPQNFTETYLAWVKILQNVLRGGLLFWLTLYILIYQQRSPLSRETINISVCFRDWIKSTHWSVSRCEIC